MLKKHLKRLNEQGLEKILILFQEYDSTGLPSDYKDYLKSDHWHTLRRLVKALRVTCEVCGYERFLHLHHRHYRTLGHEADEDVVLLCKLCHCLVHPSNANMRVSDDKKDYIEIPVWFLEDHSRDLPLVAHKVLCTIMAFNLRRKRQFRIKDICEFCGVNKKSAIKAIQALEKKGFIKVDRSKRTNRYYEQISRLHQEFLKREGFI